MYILGISCYYHESAATLIEDGKIIAASTEERFSRIKHDSAFPEQAIAYCLKEAGIGAEQLSYVVFYEKPVVKFERMLSFAVSEFPFSLSQFVYGMRNSLSRNLWIHSGILKKLGIRPDQILFVPHHLCHAAASFYPSPFTKAAYVTLDGVGEWSTGSWGIAKGSRLYPNKELRFPHSVGLLYSAFTAFLGFEVNEGEFKVMGMAAYGKPIHTKRISRVYKQYADGSIVLDESYFSFQRSSTRMFTHKFEQLFADCTTVDLAASIQAVIEEIILTMLRAIQKETGEKNLVYGGGVALNSVVNGCITKKTGFTNIYIFPAAGDDGASAGAALYVYHHVLGNSQRVELTHVFLGYKPKIKDIEQTLSNVRLHKVRMRSSQLVRTIARELSKGKIVGWYEGRAEFGPRALGHRSIIADPRRAGMKDIVNASIKFREEFRPFAPVILSRFMRAFFGKVDAHLSPYMLATYNATRKAKKLAPAIVHDDGTSRIQSVDVKTYNGTYAALLEAFYKKTGVPILLNTSFNLKGEPIVNSPQDALSTFLRSEMDILVLENFVVTKYI